MSQSSPGFEDALTQLQREVSLWRESYDRLARSRPVQTAQRLRALAARAGIGSGARTGLDTEARARAIAKALGAPARRPDGDDLPPASRRSGSGRERIRVGIASIPQREAGLAKVVEALYDQADEICVHLNGYDAIPSFLRDDAKLRAVSGVDLGDRGKFRFIDGFSGYYVTVDDDITYPSFYVEHLIDGIERYGRRAIVGWHGSILDPAITDFYDHSRRRVLEFSKDVAKDTFVHVLGTGAAALHTDTLALTLADFPAPNMADIFMALQALRHDVPLVTLAHRAGWAAGIPFPRAATIWGASTDANASRFDTRDTVREHLPVLAGSQIRTTPALLTRPPLRLSVAPSTARDQADADALEAALRHALAPLGVDVDRDDAQGAYGLRVRVDAEDAAGTVTLDVTRSLGGFVLDPGGRALRVDDAPGTGAAPRPLAFGQTAGVLLGHAATLANSQALAEPVSEWVQALQALLPGAPLLVVGDPDAVAALDDRLTAVAPAAEPTHRLAIDVAGTGTAGAPAVRSPAELTDVLPALYADPTLWRWHRDAVASARSRESRGARAARLYAGLLAMAGGVSRSSSDG
ncbi:MAG TPA: hypothetical protein VLC50_02170 [Actinomycetes bacterium]|nr:hypothetical protein [Actinomycetes bacterium]